MTNQDPANKKVTRAEETFAAIAICLFLLGFLGVVVGGGVLGTMPVAIVGAACIASSFSIPIIAFVRAIIQGTLND